MKKNILNKILPLLTLIFVYSTVAQGQYIVNFEGTGETKTAYASGNVTLSGKSWNMTEALIGTLANDWKNGTKSARMRGYSTSSMTMLENKASGIGTISFKYRRYGTEAQVDWKVEYSINNGTDWTQIGNSFTAPASDVVQTFSETVNVPGNIRLRIKRATESGTSDRRLNIDDITITDYIEAFPTITVTSPNGGESWEQGSTHNITWTRSDFTGNIKIELDNGSLPLQTLVENINVADGTWSYTIDAGQAIGSNYKIKISDQADGDPSDLSNATFSITALPSPTLTVTSPIGGESWEQGSSHAITWTSANFTGNIKIELESGAKATEILVENISSALGTWNWDIPAGQALGSDYKIKISDQADGDPFDFSNASFSIIAPLVPAITVTSPNGGESWMQGSTQNITWTKENFTGNIKIELESGAKATQTLIENVSAALGTWSWAIPAGQALGSDYKIKISDQADGNPFDYSNASFSIVALPALVINEIMYNSFEAGDNEWIELYNTGLEIVDLTGFIIKDNDNNHSVTFPSGFSINPGQFFTVAIKINTTPLFFTPDWDANAGWGLDNIGDQVRLFYPTGEQIDIVSFDDETPWPVSPDGSGPSLSLLSPGLDNSVGTNWAASRQNNGTPGAENFPPVVTVTSPNGGESWEQGSIHNITWTSLDFSGNIKIELDNGADALQTLAENIAVAAGTWSWTIDPAQTLGSSYKIKISDQADGSPSAFSDAVFSITAPPVPVITVTSPNGGESWEQGSTHAITWTMENFTGNVKIELESGAKATETLIENISSALGTWSWNIPAGQALGSDYKIKISDQADGTPSDLSDAAFSITAPPLPVIIVTSPNGGELWEQGSTHPITWTTENFTGNVKIELESGAKATEILIENVSAALGTWSWAIPAGQTLGADYKVKISDQADGTPSDLSDAAFSITAPPAPVITVTSPNGGESWEQGSTHSITWTTENFTVNVKIELESGAKTTEILIENVSAALGTWSWTIPVGQTAGSDYKIKISDQADGDPVDYSNAAFSITALPVLVINEIMYNSAGLDNEWIEIYNPGTSVVNLQGFYILDNSNSSTKVTFPAGYSISPGQYFTVSLELLAPPLPFVPDFVGNPQPSWSLGNTSDQVRIFNPNGVLIDLVTYFDSSPWPTGPDGDGPSLSLLNPGFDNNVGTSWASSRQNGGTPGAENFPPVVTVTSPDGGESWMQGSVHPITWSSSDFTGNIKIELESGAKASQILAENIPVANGFWSWTIPDLQAVGSDYKIRISDQIDGNPVDESDAAFTIVAMPRLFVTSPNGGESWMQGEVHAITWTSSDFTGNIKIELESGAKASQILAENIPVANGTWSWTIPDLQTPGSNYKIKISDQADGNPMDESNATFEIVGLPRLFVTSPNGGESWMQGEVHNITWAYSDFAGNIKIELLSGTKASEILAENIPVVQGSWGWTIPDLQAIGSDYKIRISDQIDGNPVDESDAAFTIVGMPRLFVTSPNGGESWMQGEVHAIAWTSSDFTGNIKIELESGAKASQILAENIPVANGSWSWTIPDLQTPGIDYKIKISDQIDGNPMDESDASFTIVAMPRLFVTSPNGGELWELGSVHPITWASSDFSGNIKIELLSGTKTSEILAENIPVTDGSWSWTIPEDQTIGDDYKIRISDQDDGSPADESNAAFAIFDPVVLPVIVITEIMYNPPVSGAGSLEFIELYNNDEIPVNLEGWHFSKGIGFIFPHYVLQAGDYVVIAANAGVFESTFGVPALQWTIGDLSNDGEEIELLNADNDLIDALIYDDGGEWPLAADGYGPSLALCDPDTDNNSAENWKTSVELATIISNGTGLYCTPGAGCGSSDYLSAYYPQGWVGISANVIPDKLVLNQLFAPAMNKLVVMLNETGIFWPAYNFNTIGNWNYKKGYKAKFSSKTYFVYEGTAPEDRTLNLGTGNYYIPVLSDGIVEVSDVIVPLGNAIDFLMEIHTGQLYWPAGGITPGSSGASLNYLVPGYSYYIKVLTPTTIDFGLKSSGGNVYKPSVKFENTTVWNDVVNTGDQHVISVSEEALKNLQPGDVIGVFDQNGFCTGMSKYNADEPAIPVLVYGDDMTTSEVDGMTIDERLELRIFRNGEVLQVTAIYNPQFEDHDGLFTPGGLSVINDLKSGATNIAENEASPTIYPNPGNGVFNIKVDNPVDLLEVYSVTGSCLFVREITHQQFSVDLSNLEKGLYYLKLRDKNSGNFYSEKIIIQ